MTVRLINFKIKFKNKTVRTFQVFKTLIFGWRFCFRPDVSGLYEMRHGQLCMD